MGDPIRIDVAAPSRGYAVWVGSGVLRQLPALLDQVGLGPRRFVVSTPPVWKHWGGSLREVMPDIEAIPVPDGERFKTLAQVSEVYDALVRANADRQSVVVTLGGGVIGDMAGFAAATYMRGIGLAHAPTTLLAQVDASIGGKVGVNLPGGKNLVGAFYQPWVVAIDPDVLSTLPRREFRSGLYEVIKYGMACSRDLYDVILKDLSAISRRAPEALTPVIAACCRIKAGVVTLDERDTGPREVLNFGHTAGHALESVTRYQRFLHGEAVAYGMLVAADVAAGRSILSSANQSALASLITKLGPLPAVSDLFTRPILEQMRHDKKVRDGRIRMILPTDIGTTMTVDDVTDLEVKDALVRCGVGA
jgi:3-dehydroquinate synthase